MLQTPRRALMRLAAGFVTLAVVIGAPFDARESAAAPTPLSAVFLPWVGNPAPGGTSFVPHHLVVRFNPGTAAAERSVVQARLGATVVGEIPALGVHVLVVDDPRALLALARSQAAVAYAELDYLASPLEVPATPNDPLFPEQWHHTVIGSPAAWSRSHASGVTVAIVDTGVNCDHPDLVDACTAGYDFVNDDSDATDDHGHGTQVAGIVAALTDNAIGVSGVAWGAELMPLKTLAENGLGGYSDIARAIVWATDHGAGVVNMSIGGPAETQVLQDAADYALAHGVTLVAAVGNGDSSVPEYPAALPGVIGVAATTASEERATFSNFGDYVDLTAPGVNILSTARSGGYGRFTGTSMAAPMVAGLAALLQGGDSERTPEEIARILADSAMDLGEPGWDPYYGAGRVDAGAALALAEPPTPTPIPTTPPQPTPEPALECVPLRVDEAARGELDPDTRPVVRYCFSGGDWISIRMFGSGGLDPKLELYSARSGALVAENEHGEGIGRNSFLVHRLVPGDYWLHATGRNGGNYALRMEEGRSAGVGDINKDCVIDQADRALIESSMSGWPDEAADLDLDGLVTPADILLWRGNYERGLRCPGFGP